MKFVCDRDVLNSAVSTVSRAVSSRSSLAVLEAYISGPRKTARVTIIGNDLEIGIESVIEADVKEGGEIVIDAKLFGKILASPNDSTISIETNEKYLTLIKSGKAKIEIPGIAPDEFPDLPFRLAKTILSHCPEEFLKT